MKLRIFKFDVDGKLAKINPGEHFLIHLLFYVLYPFVSSHKHCPYSSLKYGFLHFKQLFGPLHIRQLLGHVPTRTKTYLIPKYTFY